MSFVPWDRKRDYNAVIAAWFYQMEHSPLCFPRAGWGEAARPKLIRHMDAVLHARGVAVLRDTSIQPAWLVYVGDECALAHRWPATSQMGGNTILAAVWHGNDAYIEHVPCKPWRLFDFPPATTTAASKRMARALAAMKETP